MPVSVIWPAARHSSAPSGLSLNGSLAYGILPYVRGVAQPGSALAWGARGRRFKSDHPDQSYRSPFAGLLAPRFRSHRPDASALRACAVRGPHASLRAGVPLRQDSGQKQQLPSPLDDRWTGRAGRILHSARPNVVATVLPHVMVDLRIPVSELDQASWSSPGYLVGYTVVIPLAARLADAHGHAILFRLSLVLFGVASVAVAPLARSAVAGGLTCRAGSRGRRDDSDRPCPRNAGDAAPPPRYRGGYSGRRCGDGRGARPLYGGVITEAWAGDGSSGWTCRRHCSSWSCSKTCRRRGAGASRSTMRAGC